MVFAPFAHCPERLLVEVGDGTCGHAGAPEGLADVFDVACGDTGGAHLGDRFSNHAVYLTGHAARNHLLDSKTQERVRRFCCATNPK